MKPFAAKIPELKQTVLVSVTMRKEMSDRLWSLTLGLKKKGGKNITKADIVRQMVQHCIDEMDEGKYV